MIFNLSRMLPEHFAVVNLLRYITFRSACACLTALVVSFLLGPATIRWLRSVQDEWSRIETQVPHLGVVPALSALDETGPAPQLDLHPSEWEVLAEVDGERDLRRIASALRVSEFEVARTVFGLVTTGVVTLHDPTAMRKLRASLGDDSDALVTAAEVRLGAGEVEAARDAAQSALALRPEEPRVHLVLGRAQLAAGLYPEAVEACRRAIRLAPELAEAHRWCGFALAATGRFRDARESWERWEQLTDGHADEAQRLQVEEARAAAAAFERMLGGEHA